MEVRLTCLRRGEEVSVSTKWVRMSGVRAKVAHGVGYCQELGFYSEGDEGTGSSERF